MSGGEGALGKCCRIRHIVRLRQMLRRWRAKAAETARMGRFTGRIPADVPAGHVAVCVGTNSRRFVVRATHLNHPLFKKLLREAEEEYGFTNSGPLAIPCDESLFEEILRFLARSDSNLARFATLDDFKRCCHLKGAANHGFWPESRPLLHGLIEKPVW